MGVLKASLSCEPVTGECNQLPHSAWKSSIFSWSILIVTTPFAAMIAEISDRRAWLSVLVSPKPSVRFHWDLRVKVCRKLAPVRGKLEPSVCAKRQDHGARYKPNEATTIAPPNCTKTAAPPSMRSIFGAVAGLESRFCGRLSV